MIKNNQQTEEYFFEEGCYITELWNENHDGAVSIAKARVRPGETTKKHALKNTVERYLIVKGKGNVYVGGDTPQAVYENDVVVIPAGTSQYISNTGTQDLVFLAICTPRFVTENYVELK